MLINLSTVLSVPNKSEDYEVRLDLTDFDFMGNKYKVDSKEPMLLNVSHVDKDKLAIIGSMKVEVTFSCDRCLDDVIREFLIEVNKVIDFKQTEQDRIDVLDEMSFIEDCNLDVDGLVLSELLLMVPMKVLCREDCKGICKVCGTNLNKTSCDCDQTVPDPRMSVISDIFNNFKEV